MQFQQLEIAGAFKLVPQPIVDERGFFARMVCVEELEAQGLVGRFAQSSISFNSRRGTVRGMHISVAPNAETKLVRCTAGAIHDVIVDLRPGSKTHLKALSVTLSAENRNSLYIPIGIAHGFQTLQDQTEVLYMIDPPYHQGSAKGLRWNDPAIKVNWPEPISVISARDRSYPDWDRRTQPI